MNLPVHFDFIPYPVWRRRGLTPLRSALRGVSTAGVDGHPPATPAQMAHYLTRWDILPYGMNSVAARDALAASQPPLVEAPLASAAASFEGPIRLPAQWEPLEAVLLTWPILYPPLWSAHAEMAEAISAVARVDILVTDAQWASAIALFLERRGTIRLDQVRFVHMPVDDIWVRDYGPFVGFRDDGTRAAVDASYHPLEAYPSAQDDVVPQRYGALMHMPVRVLNIRTEGGNFWSDGRGTLLMTHGLFARNPHLSREEVLRRLREAFRYEKLVLVDPVWSEGTGHVDLVLKLAGARTVLLNAPSMPFNRARLEKARALLQGETNAVGEPYRVIELPTLAPYLNWGVYAIWRSYTNSLTVNGRVLVPVFRAAQDEQVLALYKSAMPEHEIIPIDCSKAANGGGAVHCLTKEIAKG
ncbi:MAG TPA: agmatine deiminase family protein [Candidatus Limnocylindrales bacterium]|nr:agmatine deiminase family protein [Candidatus Limnocylindrales bacterium]